MKAAGTRDQLEAALAQALSRHIGYTTGAYELDRILSVLDVFRDKPSAIKEEIVAWLKERQEEADDEKAGTDEYISEIISFARSMGVVQQTSPRDARLQKFSPTELGRSLLAVRQLPDKGFCQFFTARVAFLADADSLAALLTYFHGGGVGKLPEHYLSFFNNLRRRRWEWLRRAFPEPILLERISARISWLPKIKKPGAEQRLDEFTANTARHHSTPRKGWLKSLGMLDDDGKHLTSFGMDAYHSLIPATEYFWLGPPSGVQEALGISPNELAPGPYEDKFGFSEGLPPASPEETLGIVPDLTAVMVRAYPYAKLIHASQASLELAAEYVRYRSFRDRTAYNVEIAIDEVFKAGRDKLDRFSALRGSLGFYRVR